MKNVLENIILTRRSKKIEDLNNRINPFFTWWDVLQRVFSFTFAKLYEGKRVSVLEQVIALFGRLNLFFSGLFLSFSFYFLLSTCFVFLFLSFKIITFNSYNMYTYLAYDGKYYKIGQSENPENRIKQLKTGNPFLKLIHYTDKINEKTIHNLFRHKRIKGEYFQFNEAEIKKVLDVMECKILPNNKWYIKSSGKSLKKKRINIENKSYSTYIMKFGMYKGKNFSNLPKSYVKWLYENIDLHGELKTLVCKRLKLKL